MAATAFPRRERQIAGLHTAYLDHGAGPPLVALHGIPTSSALLEPMLSELAGLRVIAPDLLGQGGTELPASGRVDFEAYRRHLGTFLDEVAPAAFHLLGHDFGGVLALDWAAEHPQRVRSLTVLSTTVRRSPRVTALVVANLLGGHRLLRRALPHTLVRKRVLDPELLDHWAAPWRFRRLLRGADHFSERHLEPLRQRLSRIACPVLVVWGDRDPVFPRSHGEQILALIKQSRLAVLPECGHWSPLDAPQEVGALVREHCLASAS